MKQILKKAPNYFLSLGPFGFHRISYLDWGSEKNENQVFCVHGLSRNAHDFDRLAVALQDDFRVISMDVVGRGDSDWLEDPSGYRFGTYLTDSAALISKFCSPSLKTSADVSWVGTSMGAIIGMLLASKKNTPITKLVLNDAGAFLPWKAFMSLAHISTQTVFQNLEEVETYLRDSCKDFGDMDDVWWKHLARNGVSLTDEGVWQLKFDPKIFNGILPQLDPALPIGSNSIQGLDLWKVWDSIDCPVLILRGKNSKILPYYIATEMNQKKDKAQLVEFDDIGHAPGLATKEQIDVIKHFLKNG